MTTISIKNKIAGLLAILAHYFFVLSCIESIAGYRIESNVFLFIGTVVTAIFATLFAINNKIFYKVYAVGAWVLVIVGIEKYFF